MGCTHSLKEYKTYYDTGELRYQYYMFNDIIHGPFRCFYTNGDIEFIFMKYGYYINEHSCHDDTYLLDKLTSHCYFNHEFHPFEDHEFSRLYIFNFKELLYSDIIFKYSYQDRKIYKHGSLFIHFIQNYSDADSNFYAEYDKNILCLYLIKYEFNKYRVIHNTITEQRYINNCYQMRTTTFDRVIDITLINAVRVLQQQFRKRLYKPVLLILNNIIGIEVISKIILCYTK
jgi:hypothetical protein